MQLPVKAHYATLAMLALAEKYEGREPLPARVIALEHNIPSQFLGQLLQQLRSSGLISSTRGAAGGFLLEKSPDSITLADVIDVICPLATSMSAANPSPEKESRLASSLHDVWEELRTQQRELLESVTLSELLRRIPTSTPMFYI